MPLSHPVVMIPKPKLKHTKSEYNHKLICEMEKHYLKGQVLSPGSAKGEVCLIKSIDANRPAIENKSARDLAEEVNRFEKEVISLIIELEEVVKNLQKESFFEEAEIIQTQIVILKDRGFHRRVKERIKKFQVAAESALEHLLAEIIQVLESSNSQIFLQRSADIKDVVIRLKKKLAKEKSVILSKPLRNAKDPVVVIKELFPSLVIEAKNFGVKAFIIEKGTALSHAAILAKSFGIPVLRVENINRIGLKQNTEVYVDAHEGKLVISPMPGEAPDVIKEELDVNRSEIPQLPVKIWINITDPRHVSRKDLEGVTGIGLYRTETLFMERQDDFPNEDDQFQVYSSLFKRCMDHPVTIRTLDIGGDKLLPYFSLGPQENPYLGFRAHRIYRFHPEILINQIRAILRAGVYASKLRILYPMIEDMDELLFVQGLLREAIQSLKVEGLKYNKNFLQGVLIEVPSAVWDFKELLSHVDFASVGTNDLLQYFFAVDRNNANVSKSFLQESPVSLKMLRSMVDTSKALNKPLNICGEIASDIHFLPLLVGLGFEHISIDSHAIPPVQKILASLDISACKQLLKVCLDVGNAGEVRAILDKFNPTNKKYITISMKEHREHIDSVCKMVVHTDGNELIVQHEGKKYYFCSKQCQDRFSREKKLN